MALPYIPSNPYAVIQPQPVNSLPQGLVLYNVLSSYMVNDYVIDPKAGYEATTIGWNALASLSAFAIDVGTDPYGKGTSRDLYLRTSPTNSIYLSAAGLYLNGTQITLNSSNSSLFAIYGTLNQITAVSANNAVTLSLPNIVNITTLNVLSTLNVAGSANFYNTISAGNIYSSGGNSINWNSAYNISTAYQNASGSWQSTYGTVSSLSANWNRAYNTATTYQNISGSFATNTLLQSTSALLTPLTTTNTLTSQLVTNTAFNNYQTNVAASTATLLPTTIYQSASSSFATNTALQSSSALLTPLTLTNTLTGQLVTNTAFSNYQTNVAASTATLLPTTIYQSASSNWQNAYTTVQNNSAVQWNYQGSDLKALSAGWQNTYYSVSSLSANWNNAYSTLTANSGTWNNVWSTVNSNSAVQWNYQGSDLKALSGGWQNTYYSVSSLSANWNTAYALVSGGVTATISLPQSANWQSTYATVSSLSANWNTAYSFVTGASSSFTTGTLTVSSTFPTVSGNQTPLIITGNSNQSVYNQIQNTFTGVSASVDIVATNDTNNAYFDLGINSSQYNGNNYIPNFTIAKANDSYAYSVSGNLTVGTATSGIGDLVFFTGGTLSGSQVLNGNEVMRITNTGGPYTGNIGIGTTTPGANLTVNGTISSNSNVTANNLQAYTINALASPNNGIAWADRNNSGYANQWYRSNAASYFYDNSPGAINNGNLMAITSAGNVGIGTNSPNTKLTVVGNIIASGAVYGNTGVTLLTGVTTYTIQLSDSGNLIGAFNGNASLSAIPSASINYPVGFQTAVMQLSTARVSLSGTGSPTVNQANGYYKTTKQYSSATLMYLGSPAGWVIFGDVSA